MATRAQYQKLAQKLQAQAFGLPQLAEEITELLAKIETTPKAIHCQSRDKEFILDFNKKTRDYGDCQPDAGFFL